MIFAGYIFRPKWTADYIYSGRCTGRRTAETLVVAVGQSRKVQRQGGMGQSGERAMSSMRALTLQLAYTFWLFSHEIYPVLPSRPENLPLNSALTNHRAQIN